MWNSSWLGLIPSQFFLGSKHVVRTPTSETMPFYFWGELVVLRHELPDRQHIQHFARRHASELLHARSNLDHRRTTSGNRHAGCRAEVIGRTVGELGIWEDPKDRSLMLAQLQQRGPIRNAITRLRTKSGEVKTTAYSADKIQFDGQSCILAVSEDLPDDDKSFNN